MKTLHKAAAERMFALLAVILAGLFSVGDVHAQTTGAPCHLLTAAHQIPAGFGAAYNTLSTARELLLKVSCATDGVRLTVGNGSPLQYIYKHAYQWKNNQWSPISFVGDNEVGNWLIGEGRGLLTSRTAEDLKKPNFFVAYICTWTGSQWKCGCRDSTCTENPWQLQAFQHEGPLPSPSDDTSGDLSTGTDLSGDPAGCLATFTGPVQTLRGEQRTKPNNEPYGDFYLSTWEKQTRIDARTAVWKGNLVPDIGAVRGCYPVELGATWVGCGHVAPDPQSVEEALQRIASGNAVGRRFDLWAHHSRVPPPREPICWVGGTMLGTQTKAMTWGENKGVSQGAALTFNSRGAVIESVRMHNVHDGFMPLLSQGFTIRGSWLTYIRDDCVTNEGHAAGLIEDNLFDGCFNFYSSLNSIQQGPTINPNKTNVVTIRNNLIRHEAMPGPPISGKSTRNHFGYRSGFFKMWDSRGLQTRIALHDNIFLADHPQDGSAPTIFGQGLTSDRLVSCSNNILIWLGPGNYPGEYPKECFTVTKDRSIWDKAVAKWKADHPGVARIPGVDG